MTNDLISLGGPQRELLMIYSCVGTHSIVQFKIFFSIRVPVKCMH